MCRPLVAWLRDQKWEVYQEVKTDAGGKVADIVAAQGPLLWLIECKVNFGLAVMEQAWEWQWRGYVHQVSLATPRGGNRFTTHVLKQCGIGQISISELGGVKELIRPVLQRRAPQAGRMREILAPHKGIENPAPAGSPSGSYGYRVSAFEGTCHAVRAAVRANPGIAMKELIALIGRGHYADVSSARSNLARWAELGYIDGVTTEREGRKLRLYPTEAREEKRGED